MDVIKSSPDDQVDIIVLKNSPLSEKKFMRWWQENQALIEQRYDIPSKNSNNAYRVLQQQRKKTYMFL